MRRTTIPPAASPTTLATTPTLLGDEDDLDRYHDAGAYSPTIDPDGEPPAIGDIGHRQYIHGWPHAPTRPRYPRHRPHHPEPPA